MLNVFFPWCSHNGQKKRKQFFFDSVASILKLVNNFNDVTCNQFYIVKADSTLLKQVKETAKYSWAKSKN